MPPSSMLPAFQLVEEPSIPPSGNEKLPPISSEPDSGLPLSSPESTPSVPYPLCPIWGTLSMPRVSNGETPISTPVETVPVS